MAVSDEFLRQARKRSSNDMIGAGALRNLFFDFMRDFPDDLRWDIFNLFYPDSEDSMEYRTESAVKLAAVIDLAEDESEEGSPGLTDDELMYISEGVNDYALELSDDLIMNIMKTAVSRGLMG